MTELKEKTISEIVADDFRTAAVFQKYGLDFCCGGGRPVDEACKAKKIDLENVLNDLESVAATPSNGTPRFNSFELDTLIEYIIANHHRYISDMAPVILQHIEKVARVHGERHPETVTIARTFEKVVNDMMLHMRKEESMLFPYINTLVGALRSGATAAPGPFGTVENPIRAMESEHLIAGNEMDEIRRLSNDYTPPDDACMTYRVAFKELREFESDLHHHVHLENNILFPKALLLETEVEPRGEVTTVCEFHSGVENGNTPVY